ncbi:hypothetical protein ABBQ38_014766 [Trebouxia sp. C0009 RCD-2024]
MPRTYGEVCPSSFSDLLALGGDNKVLIDCGSGHGSLVKAAVEQFGCIFAIGIEKYKEPAAIADKMFTSSSRDLQAKMRFLLEDVNDSDIPQHLQGLSFSTLILFCNNLAFHDGTVHRSSIAFKEVMARFPDKSVFVVSTRPMKLLESHFIRTLPLKMSWSEDLHDVFVYASGMIN